MTGTGHTCTRYCIIYTHVRATCGEMPWQRIAPTHTPPSHKNTPPSHKKKKQDAERLLSCLATCMSVGSFPTKPFSEAVGCNYGENCADGSSTRGHGVQRVEERADLYVACYSPHLNLHQHVAPARAACAPHVAHPHRWCVLRVRGAGAGAGATCVNPDARINCVWARCWGATCNPPGFLLKLLSKLMFLGGAMICLIHSNFKFKILQLLLSPASDIGYRTWKLLVKVVVVVIVDGGVVREHSSE